MSGPVHQEQWSPPAVGVPRHSAVRRLLVRIIDVVVAILMLVVTAPVSVAAGCAVKAGSRGPMLVREVRVGRGGRRFQMITFRTTGVDADGAARTNAVGRVLVALAIDDLPQWWNVLRGDLHIVGPPPARPDDPGGHGSSRHDVQPGLTGLWRSARR
jgi:lipopolysaccharide/colanic/teichoic acid biosynthesis glycosyltransferase